MELDTKQIIVESNRLRFTQNDGENWPGGYSILSRQESWWDIIWDGILKKWRNYVLSE